VSKDESPPEKESTDSEAPPPKPEAIEVKITNSPVKEVKWNDEVDDQEYYEIVLTDDEKNI